MYWRVLGVLGKHVVVHVSEGTEVIRRSKVKPMTHHCVHQYRRRRRYLHSKTSLLHEALSHHPYLVPNHAQEMSTNSETNDNPPCDDMQKTEDVAIFGSLNTTISDYFYERAENALSVCISSLPHLSSTTGGELILLNRLKKAYWKNIDLCALYCARNIFTTTIFKPRRRQAIVALYNDANFDPNKFNDEFKQSEATSESPESTDTTITETDIPPCHEPRSAEDLLAVQEENQQLRKQLKELKRKREETNCQTNNLKSVKQLIDEVEKTLTQNVDINTLYHDVTSAVIGCRDLQELQLKGNHLQAELIRIRKGRQDDNFKDEIESYSPNDRRLEAEACPSFETKIERDRTAFKDLSKVLTMLSDKGK
jgi:hypothetical protein